MSVRSETTAAQPTAVDLPGAIAEVQPVDAHLGEGKFPALLLSRRVDALCTCLKIVRRLRAGQSYAVATPENPLQRQLVVSVRSSLNELCAQTASNQLTKPTERSTPSSQRGSLDCAGLNKGKGVWAPSGDALKSIFQCARNALCHLMLGSRPTVAHTLPFRRQKRFTSLDGSAENMGGARTPWSHRRRTHSLASRVRRRPQVDGPSRHVRHAHQVDIPDEYAAYPIPFHQKRNPLF